MGAQDTRVALGVFLCALTGWTLVSMTHGGTDLGRLPVGPEATALAWGAVGAALLAVVASWLSRGMSWGRTAMFGLGAFGGLVAWSAASMAWSAVPDLAWLTTNRLAFGLAALTLGVGLSVGRHTAARDLAIGLAVATVPILAWALGSRVLGEWLAPTVDPPRLVAPIGHANTLALIAVFAVPGALCLAADRRWRRHAAVILMVALLVVAMTGSRSGLIALVAGIGVAVWLQPNRPAMLAALWAGLVGAIPAVVFALGTAEFTTEPFLSDPADRRGAGLLLGALIVAGAAVSWALVDVARPGACRLARVLDRPKAGRIVAAAAAALVAAGIVLAVVLGREANQTGGRQLSLDSNHRSAWWGEAWRGFVDAPLIGHGSGSFPLTHLAERNVGAETLQVRQPHQLGLELMTELGVVGLVLGLLLVGVVVCAARRVGRGAGPALAIVIPFLIQAQLDTPWSSPAAYVPALAAGGVILGLVGGSATARRGAARGLIVGVVALGVCASALVVWSGERRASPAPSGGDACAAASSLKACVQTPRMFEWRNDHAVQANRHLR